MRPTGVKGMGNDFVVKTFHFILVQIRFHLTNVILKISDSHDVWFFLSLQKQSNICNSGAECKFKANVCKAAKLNEWKILLQHLQVLVANMLLTFSSHGLLTEVERHWGQSGAAVAEHISCGNSVPKLSEAQSNVGTPALGIENLWAVGNSYCWVLPPKSTFFATAL